VEATPSTAELLGRAAALVPVLRERAARAEQLRQVPLESVKDLVASGLARIGTPSRYGGNGADIDTGHAVAWELGRGCGSTGWCASLWIVHNWWLGHFPAQAQEDFFATGPDTLASTCLDPTGGTAPPAPGGWPRPRPRWTRRARCTGRRCARCWTGRRRATRSASWTGRDSGATRPSWPGCAWDAPRDVDGGVPTTGARMPRSQKMNPPSAPCSTATTRLPLTVARMTVVNLSNRAWRCSARNGTAS
jgi:hypothetical protein